MRVNAGSTTAKLSVRMSRNRVFPSRRLVFIPASAGRCTAGRAYAAPNRAVSRGSKKLLRVVNCDGSDYLKNRPQRSTKRLKSGIVSRSNLPMESTLKHLTMEELEAALDHLRDAPKDEGVV